MSGGPGLWAPDLLPPPPLPRVWAVLLVTTLSGFTCLPSEVPLLQGNEGAIPTGSERPWPHCHPAPGMTGEGGMAGLGRSGWGRGRACAAAGWERIFQNAGTGVCVMEIGWLLTLPLISWLSLTKTTLASVH